MSEKILSDILEESCREEFTEFDDVPEYKPSLQHRIRMKKFFKSDGSSSKSLKHISLRLVFTIILLGSIECNNSRRRNSLCIEFRRNNYAAAYYS